MRRPEVETLAQYVSRIMREKGLKHNEVKRMSGGRITDGYVRGIMTGKARNPSVDKLKALGRGLGVSEEEIFKVARGLAVRGESGRQADQSDYRVIVDLMSAALKNRTLKELLSEAARLPLDAQEEAVRMLKYLNARKHRRSRARKRG